MKAYSQDLRLRLLAAVDRGVPRTQVASLFGVSPATIKRWLQCWRETGGIALKPRPGRPSEKMAALRAGLLPQLEAHPDATLEEHCRWWEEAHQMSVSHATMSRVIIEHFGWTRKKSP